MSLDGTDAVLPLLADELSLLVNHSEVLIGNTVFLIMLTDQLNTI